MTLAIQSSQPGLLTGAGPVLLILSICRRPNTFILISKQSNHVFSPSRKWCEYTSVPVCPAEEDEGPASESSPNLRAFQNPVTSLTDLWVWSSGRFWVALSRGQTLAELGA